MGTGIIVCGLNGSGKSTFGKALAEKLHFHFIDNEDLYFPKEDSSYIYAAPRTREEVEKLLRNEIKSHENFVFTSVKGDYGEMTCPLFQFAVLVHVPREIRLERVRDRSFQKFGERMLKGGDLYEKEEAFFEMVRSRPEHSVEQWAQSFPGPVWRIDGTRPVEENVDVIVSKITEVQRNRRKKA